MLEQCGYRKRYKRSEANAEVRRRRCKIRKTHLWTRFWCLNAILPHCCARQIDREVSTATDFRNRAVLIHQSCCRKQCLSTLHVSQHAVHHILSDATETVVHILKDRSLCGFEFLDGELITAHTHCPVMCRTTGVAEETMGQRQGSEDKDVWADGCMMTCVGLHKKLEIPGIVGRQQGLPPRSSEAVGQGIKDAGSKGNNLVWQA